jgi:hypothetical protein
MRRLLLILSLLFSAFMPASLSAQTTHLNVGSKQILLLTFWPKNGDQQGVYRRILAQFQDGTTNNDWSIPPGMTLVITDVHLPAINPGNPNPKEGLYWVCAWESSNPASGYLNLRFPITVRVDANTDLTTQTRSLTAGLVFDSSWPPAMRDLMNDPKALDISLVFVRPTALGYLVPTK